MRGDSKRDNRHMAVPTGERRIVSVLLADIADSTAIGERLGPERSKFLFDEVDAPALRRGEALRRHDRAAHRRRSVRALRRAARARRRCRARGARGARDAGGAGRLREGRRRGVRRRARRPRRRQHRPRRAASRRRARRGAVQRARRHGEHRGAPAVRGRQRRRRGQPGDRAADRGSVRARVDRRARAEGQVRAARGLPRRRRAGARGATTVAARRARRRACRARRCDGRPRRRARRDRRDHGRARDRQEPSDRGGASPRRGPRALLRHAGHLVRGGRSVLPVARAAARVPRPRHGGSRGARAARAEDAARGGARRAGGCVTTRFSRRFSGSRSRTMRRSGSTALARDSVQRQSHEAVAELVRALARERPVCLVLEDLHFADEPTLELFEELLQLAEEEPVALLLAYRHDPDLRSWELGEAARRRYRHRFRELLLEPLDAADGARARGSGGGTRSLRRGRGAARRAHRRQSALPRGGGARRGRTRRRRGRAGGDPGDAAGAARPAGARRPRRRLRRIGRRPQLRPAAAGTARPARAAAPRALGAAAARPRRRRAAAADARVPLPARARPRGGVLEPARPAPPRPAPRRRRRRSRSSDENELSEAYGLLAHHFAEADEPERAARYLLEAGDAARALYADEEAIANYRRALSFLDRLGEAGQGAARALQDRARSTTSRSTSRRANAAWAEAFTYARPATGCRARRRPSASRRRCCARRAGCPVTATTSWRGRSRRTSSADCCVSSAASTSSPISPIGSRCRRTDATYVFQLREDLRWSDGEPLGAADFAETYAAMREEEVPTAHLLYDVEARAVDDLTLELRLPEPVAHIPYLFAQLPFFPWPRHKLEELGAEWRADAELVGNGPFALADANEERVVFTRNPHWPSSTSNVAEVTIRIRDPFGSRDEWQAGRLDFIFVPDLHVGRLSRRRHPPHVGVEHPVHRLFG